MFLSQVEAGSAWPRRPVQEAERGQEGGLFGLVLGQQQPAGLPLGGRALPVGQGHIAEQSALLHKVSPEIQKANARVRLTHVCLFLQPPERDNSLGPPGHGVAVQVPHRVQLCPLLGLQDRDEAETSAEEAGK